MNSDTNESAHAEHAKTLVGRSNLGRVAALSAIVLVAFIAGPPGLAVGPSQQSAVNPVDPAVTATALRAQIPATRVSFEMIEATEELTTESQSYGEQRVGPLSFPEGAIEVPWGVGVGSTTGRAYPAGDAIQTADAGQSVSAPRAELQNIAYRPNQGVARTTESIAASRGTVAFDRTSTDLSEDAAATLNALAEQLRGGSNRIELQAYGGAASDRSHNARRIALRRALAVRNHLMAQGISEERMIVRALGGASDGGNADRVDVITAGS